MEPQQIVTLVVGVVFLGVLMFLPQWQARRRRQKQMEGLHVGARVVTVGGIIGNLTYLDTERNRARVRIAHGVEIEMLAVAISSPLQDQDLPATEEPADE